MELKSGNATEELMAKRFFGFALSAMLFAFCSFAEAQQPTKIPRIGIVSGNRNEPGSRIKIFRQALQELDYVEGKNILFEYRDTEGIGTASRELWPNS
jgi:hypothetical protein